MIYFLYEVKCCFLSILLHKYLILCFFTSYSSETIIRRKFGFIQKPNNLTADYSYCFSLFWWLQPKTNRHVTFKRMSTSWDTIWYCLHFKGKQRIYFIFYPFSLNLIHIYLIFFLKLLHFYFLYEVLLFMKHQYCHCTKYWCSVMKWNIQPSPAFP